MSFCRWSTDDFQCDLYVWEDVSGGYMIATAARRMVFEKPLPEPIRMTEHNVNDYVAREREVFLLPYHYEDIELPYACQIFHEPTSEEAADRVAELRKIGYRCPDTVEDDLRAESEETA